MNTCLANRFVWVGFVTIILAGAFSPVDAQASAWLELDAMDATGRTWRPTTGDAVIDLADTTDRHLTLTARPMLSGVASLVFSVDGVPRASVDLGTLERELAIPMASSRGDAEEIVAASLADAARWPAGFTYHTSSDLELGVDPSHGPQLVYVAFPEIAVPPSADVVHAEVRFTADGDSSGALELTVAGVPVIPPDAALQDVEGSASGVLSALRRSATSVPWTPEAAWVDGEQYATPDLTAIALDAWADRDGSVARSLALIFEIITGDGTRRATSFDTQAGRNGASPSLHLTLVEPAPSDPVVVELPAGDAVLTVTAHAQAGGAGATLATFDATVTGAETAAPPAAAAPPATDEAPSADAVPPADDAAPAPEPGVEAAAPATEAVTIQTVDLRSRADGVSLLTVVFDAPTTVDVTPVIRSGTCAAPGSVLIALRTVLAGQDGSVTEIAVSAAALRLGGFVVTLDGIPDVCARLD